MKSGKRKYFGERFGDKNIIENKKLKNSSETFSGNKRFFLFMN
jgi:hypothetical protein